MATKLLGLLMLLAVTTTNGRTVPGSCSQFSLTYPPTGTYLCPGSNITYTCTLSSSDMAVVTVWSEPSQCQMSLVQRAGGIAQTFTPESCGNLSAVTTNVTSTCYTSVLTIPADQALNGTTVVCQDGITGAVVGSDTVNLRMAAPPNPVGNMTSSITYLNQLAVTWTTSTIGGVPTSYNVTINGSSSPMVIADNGSSVYTHTFTGLVSDTLYTVSVVAINCVGSSKTILWHGRTRAVESYISDARVSHYGPSNVFIDCIFLNETLYCLVCCSTDPSVPPDSSVYNISSTRGTSVTVDVGGLTSGQMYYCTAAGTDTNSSTCGGPVVGAVKAYLNFSMELDKHVLFSGSGQHRCIIVLSVSVVTAIFILFRSV